MLESVTVKDIAAWWGAVVATAALGWNVVTALRSGARVRVTAQPNMKVFPRMPPTEDKKFVSVTAINQGTAPTTVTHFCGYYQERTPFYRRRIPKVFFVVSGQAGLGNNVPHVLKPGEEWRGFMEQEGDGAFDLTKGDLYIGVHHNQRRKPIYKRVRIQAPAPRALK